MPKGAVLLGTLLSSVLLFSGCGATSESPPNPQQAVQPNVLAISPTNIPAGSGGFTLSITGTGLGMTSQVNFGNAILAPSSATATNCAGSASCATLAVPVPAHDVAAPGEVAVSVTNPGTSGGTSNQGNFFVLSKSSFPVEESVSNATPPVPGDAPSTHSSAAIDGFFVAFDSTADNLVSGAVSGHSQIYLRQNCFAVGPNCTPQTTLLSAAPDGSPGSGGVNGSDKPFISPDGRFVVLESDDTNLAPGATQPIEQIYLRDTCQSVIGPVVPGCTPQTTLVSASASGAPGNAASSNPGYGVLGQHISFMSSALNMVSQSVPSGVQQIYLRVGCIAIFGPRVACQPSSAVLESVDAAGNPGNKDSTNPSLDAGGLVVGFQSLADNIVASTPGNGFQQIYLRATCLALPSPVAGGFCKNTAQAVSVDSSGHLGTADSVTPAVGPFGNFGVFATRAPNLLPANTSNQQIVSFNACFDLPPIPCSSAKGDA